jgi:hypothetical protein
METNNPNKKKHTELEQAPKRLSSGDNVPTLIQDDLFDEANYPKEFDINVLKSLPTFAKRVAYATEKLGKLGKGSSRIVFEADDNTVLKVAKNAKGLAQNGLEEEISRLGWYDFVSKVFDADPNSLWIESEKATKMKPSSFKELTGFNFRDWTNTLMAEYTRRTSQRGGAMYMSSDDYEKIVETDFFQDMLNFIVDFDIMPGDFTRISSWGVVNRDGVTIPILIDYGITKSIYNDFYVSKK